jgi:hypothetical protein
MLSGSFKVGSSGERLFFPWRAKMGYVVPNERQWRALQFSLAIAGVPFWASSGLICLTLLVLGMDPGLAPLFIVVPFAVSIAWVAAVTAWCVLRLERTREVLTPDERRAIKRSIMHPSLFLTVGVAAVGGMSLGIGAAAVQFSASGLAIIFVIASGALLAYFLRRLFRPLPPLGSGTERE